MWHQTRIQNWEVEGKHFKTLVSSPDFAEASSIAVLGQRFQAQWIVICCRYLHQSWPKCQFHPFASGAYMLVHVTSQSHFLKFQRLRQSRIHGLRNGVTHEEKNVQFYDRHWPAIMFSQQVTKFLNKQTFHSLLCLYAPWNRTANSAKNLPSKQGFFLVKARKWQSAENNKRPTCLVIV